jgi:hypothetical protein
MRDIYNPPPAPIAFDPPQPEPLAITAGDLAWLVGLLVLLIAASVGAWNVEPTLGMWVSIGGLFVILESWFSGLTFLRRHPADQPTGRWIIFVAALMPWLVGLGFATALMLGLFWLSDWSAS